jgi:hypothetical protein
MELFSAETQMDSYLNHFFLNPFSCIILLDDHTWGIEDHHFKLSKDLLAEPYDYWTTEAGWIGCFAAHQAG